MAENPIEPAGVHRTIDLDADPDEVWEFLVDDDQRADWFGGPTRLDPAPGAPATFTDPDGTRRDARIDHVETGRRLAWTWWPADGSEASTVDVELVPIDTGTRVTVTEVPLTPTMQAMDSPPPRFLLVEFEHVALLRHHAPAVMA